MFTYYKLICDEYTYRYGKEHGAKDNWWIFRNPPKNILKQNNHNTSSTSNENVPRMYG